VLLWLLCPSDVTGRRILVSKQRIEHTKTQFGGLLSCLYVVVWGIAVRTRHTVGFPIEKHQRANSRARLACLDNIQNMFVTRAMLVTKFDCLLSKNKTLRVKLRR